MSSRKPITKLDKVIKAMTSRIHSYSVNPQTDFTRKRKLPADTLIKTILNMQGGSLNSELYKAFDYEHRMSASAFCQARAKLQPELFELLFRQFNRTMTNPKTMKTNKAFQGYRVFAIDGSDFNVPFNPNSKFFVENGNNKSFCQLHANIMFDLLNRTYQDCIIQGRSGMNERRAALTMMHGLSTQTRNIVIMDRGYGGYNMIENCNRMAGLRYVIRERVSETSALRDIADLPDAECDRDIETVICRDINVAKANGYVHYHYRKKDTNKAISKNTKYGTWDFESPCPVKYRVVKFRINNPETGREEWEVLVTNLSRAEFPLAKMKELYHMRWDIETSFRELKYALGGVQFHSKKDDFVIQELFAHLTMFNLVSRTISKVDVNVNSNKGYDYAIDFKMACVVIRQHFTDGKFDMIGNEIANYINPIRPDRSDTRKEIKPKSAIWFTYRVA